VLGRYFVKDIIGIEGGRGVESLTGAGVSSVPAVLFAPHVAAVFLKFRGCHFVFAGWAVVGDVLPKRSPLTVEPTLQTVPSESDPLVLMLFAGAQGSTQDTFGQHFLLTPVSDVVVVSGVGHSPGKAL